MEHDGDGAGIIFALCGLGLTSVFGAVAALCILSKIVPWMKRSRADLMRTEVIYVPNDSMQQKFPTMIKANAAERPKFTESSLYLSVIVPAMNEEERLPVMLDECLNYLKERKSVDPGFTYEIIVVDDGSVDETANVGAKYGRLNSGTVKVLKLDKNRGKGGAVRVGVLHAAGQLILFADADGATKFKDFELLENEMKRFNNGKLDESFPGVVVGSRAHLEAPSKAERAWYRTLLMVGFHLLVWLFAVRKVRDTQCGFKLFTRGAAARLFPVIHLERWAFDVELLYLAEKWHLAVAEVCVEWKEVAGSKLTPLMASLEMGRDLVLIWFRYQVGIWTDEQPKC